MPAAAIVGGIGVVGQVAGGLAKSGAAGAALDQANRAAAAAAPMPQEIKALEDSVRQNEYVINRERDMIKAIDPTILETAKQAYQMLQGQESAMLDPIRRQRAREKQVLSETMRRQLGPGWETSSAGIEAISRFDSETNDHLASAQQNALGQLLGTTMQGAGMARQNEANANLSTQRAAGMFGDISKRVSSAYMGGIDASNRASQGAGGGWDALAGVAKGASQIMGFLDTPSYEPSRGSSNWNIGAGDYTSGISSIKNPLAGTNLMGPQAPNTSFGFSSKYF